MNKLINDDYGFQWGSLMVSRLISNDKKGWVIISLKTPKYKDHGIQIYCTKTGKVRIFVKNKELRFK